MVEPVGSDENRQRMASHEKAKTPTCFPTNKPKIMPKGSGINMSDNLVSNSGTPALTKTNSGIMAKAIQG